MSNNCLVTKLKGSVQNASLPYYGELVINGRVFTTSSNDLLINNTGNTSSVKWESDKDLYSSVYGTAGRVNLGRSGSVAANSSAQLYYDEDVEVKVHPMYDVHEISTHNTCPGQINIDNFKTNSEAIHIIGYRSGGFYGHLSELDKPIVLSSSSYDVRLPLSLDMRGYSNVTIPQDQAISAVWISSYPDPFLNNNLAGGSDLCGIFNVEHLANNLTEVRVDVTNKLTISNIELFANCPNLRIFVVHMVTSVGGSIVTGFGSNINMSNINIQFPTPVDFKPLFDAWKANGKVNSTTAVWLSSSTPVDGQVYADARYNIVFDANGDWTISAA